jgi:hypothetical protein
MDSGHLAARIRFHCGNHFSFYLLNLQADSDPLKWIIFHCLFRIVELVFLCSLMYATSPMLTLESSAARRAYIKSVLLLHYENWERSTISGSSFSIPLSRDSSSSSSRCSGGTIGEEDDEEDLFTESERFSAEEGQKKHSVFVQ